MSTSEDTSAIDEKKTEDTGTYSPDFKGFIYNYVTSIIFTIGISIFIIGGLGLYTTKVAQANILPDNIEKAPYTIIDREVKSIPIDMNIMRSSFFADNKSTLSQKAYFNSQEYLDSFNKSFLCSLKKNADPNAGIFANAPLYFSFVYENIIAKNFLAINFIFFYLSYLPESIIMLIYSFFGIFIWILLFFYNICISILYHIINIPQLFRTVSNNNDKKWESVESISFFHLMKFFLFFFFYLPIGSLSAFIVPIFFTLYGLICPLYATYEVKQSNQKLNIIDFIKDTFAYKKFFFFILATISLIMNGIKFMGYNSLVGIIIAILFAYFMGLYINDMPDSGKDGFSFKIRQNLKQATETDINLQNPTLVDICQRVPIDDQKIDNYISKGYFRPITKPKAVGGEIDDLPITSTSTIPTNINETASAPPLPNEIDNTPLIETTTNPTNINESASAPPLEGEITNEKMTGGKKNKA